MIAKADMHALPVIDEDKNVMGTIDINDILLFLLR
ncbi:CBS domain-containing protein [Parapedobacter defluvii]